MRESTESSPSRATKATLADADASESEPTLVTGKHAKGPTTIGRYIVLDLLGVGGMGMVCTAYDPKLERKVALKLLRRHASGSDNSKVTAGQARLFREAQALAKLSHPNVITVHDVDTHDGQLFIAMEYVEGKSLKAWTAGQRHPWKQVLEVFLAAGRGLAAAHAAGLVHRDFKPGNVILGDDGRVRVLDFGLVKGENLRGEDPADLSTDEMMQSAERGILAMVQSASDLTLTQAGRTVGTPAYMAPEQHLGLPVGPATDQFSFCLALYEALYGQLPFAGTTPEEQFRNVIEGNVCEPPRTSGAPPVPAWIHRIILRGLHPQPKERFPTMEALLTELGNDPARRRRRWLAGGTGVVVLGGMLAGVAYLEQARSNVCSDAEERMVGVWDDGRRDAVRQTFLGTQKPFASDAWNRVEERLNQYRRSWVTTHTEVCRATRVHGDQSDALLDVRMACLKRRQQDLQALADVLEDADSDVVQESVDAVLRLEDPALCASVEQPLEANRLPVDPASRAAVESVQNALSQAEALWRAGRYGEALNKARETVARSSAVEHPPTHAEAMLTLARMQDTAGESAQAEATFRKTIELAAKVHAGRIEAQAWVHLIYVIGFRQKRFDDGLDMVLPANAALERIAAGPRLRASNANNIASVHFARGDWEDAERFYSEAIALLEAAYHPDDAEILQIRNNLGSTMAKRGRKADAREQFTEVLAATQRLNGPRHPKTATLHHNLGNLMLQIEQSSLAVVHYEQALEIRTEALGPNHPDVADSWFSLGLARKAQNDHERALVAFERCLEIAERLDEPYRRLSSAYANVARLLGKTKRPEAGVAYLRRVVELSEGRLPADDPSLVHVRLELCALQREHGNPEKALPDCLRALETARASLAGEEDGHSGRVVSRAAGQVADVLFEVGDFAGAIDHYESAISLASARGGAKDQLGKWQFSLAKALWNQRRRREARAVADQALVTFRDMKRQNEAADVTAWLTAVR